MLAAIGDIRLHSWTEKREHYELQPFFFVQKAAGFRQVNRSNLDTPFRRNGVALRIAENNAAALRFALPVSCMGVGRILIPQIRHRQKAGRESQIKAFRCVQVGNRRFKPCNHGARFIIQLTWRSTSG